MKQVAKPLDYYVKKYNDRDVAILKAYESGGYSMQIIGDYFGLHYSRISRIVKAKDKTCPLFFCGDSCISWIEIAINQPAVHAVNE